VDVKNSFRDKSLTEELMEKDLPIMQQKFVAEYLISGNATRAAIAAGYSAKSAAPQGHQLLKKPKVKAMLSAKSGELMKRYDVLAERALEELYKIAFADPRKLFNADGSPKNLTDLDSDTAAAISAFEVVDLFDGSQGDQKRIIGSATKAKFANKLKALELILRYQILQKDRIEHPRPLTLEELVCGVRKDEDTTAE
jgi:phage terminase small subunit